MRRKKSATVYLQFRMKEPLRARAERAAKAAGVSMNAEMVRRLEKSFLEDDMIDRIRQVIGEEQPPF